jgi:hypothetical protein
LCYKMQNSVVKEVTFILIDLISVRLFISYLPSIILITITQAKAYTAAIC